MILTGNEGCKCESNLDVDVTTGHVYQHPSFDGARLASISPTKERLALAGERRRLDVGGVWWGNVTVLLLYPCHHFPSHPPPTPPPPPSSRVSCCFLPRLLLVLWESPARSLPPPAINLFILNQEIRSCLGLESKYSSPDSSRNCPPSYFWPGAPSLMYSWHITFERNVPKIEAVTWAWMLRISSVLHK